MISKKQQIWLNHLSDSDKITIKPFDPSAAEKFTRVKKIINKKLGSRIRVYHRGATSLGISGQDEIDVYIPVRKNLFNNYIQPLSELFGPPRSLYPLERARYITQIDSKHVDVFLVNEESEGWTRGVIFEKYLKYHPVELENYRILKESGNGISVRDYYTNKIEFINKIIKKAKKEKKV